MLTSISPIDGRYQKITQPLAKFFSEQALMKYRLMVEGEYFIALSEAKLIRRLSDREKKLVRSLYNLTSTQAQIISDIEKIGYKNIKPTDHDVKAVEYYMKDRLEKTSLKDVLGFLHFAITSYDVNTPARGLMLSDALEQAILPALAKIQTSLDKLAKKYAKLAMLARTHGQSASPTTFGKEFKVFSQRLNRQLNQLKGQKISVKFSGATGNFNAHIAAFPKVDWIKFSKKFIAGLNSLSLWERAGVRVIKLEPNLIATQIDPHDSEAEIFDCLRRINVILLDFNQDMWRYISDDWIVQKPAEGSVGSSTMPHKVNPIKFENSEGNLGLANALLNHFSTKLPISRLQRDLSDSTVERNFGVALAHSLIAYESLLKGLSGITVNQKKVADDLCAHPEVLAEAIQTVLRREGVAMPYEKLKELTRGKQISLADLHKFIDSLQIDKKIKNELKKVRPENYTGLANKLASM